MGEDNNTSLGLDENLEGALAYLLGFVTGIALLLIEKDNNFIRFHAMQSTVIFLGIFILRYILFRVPLFGWMIAQLISLLGLIIWIVGMVKAYQGELYKFPVVGDFAATQIRNN